MNHEKIIKRECGTQYKIQVLFFVDSYNRQIGATYKCSVSTRGKGKRKWEVLPDTLSDWDYRSLSMEDRRTHEAKNMLRFVTKEELLSTKVELWHLLEPKE